MVEVSIPALEAAIEALDEKIWRLMAERDQSGPSEEDAGDLDDVLLSYMKCAVSLRDSYQLALEQGFQMRPYGQLVKSEDLMNPRSRRQP